jgi:hypothetical protein
MDPFWPRLSLAFAPEQKFSGDASVPILRAISFYLMQLSTQQAFSDYWPSSRCVEPVVFAYSSDLNRP